jgi:hypothetical protein
VSFTNLPPFTAGARVPPEGWDERFSMPIVQRSLSQLEEGQASSFLPSRDGGFILYFKGRQAATDEEITEGLPDFTESLRQYRLSQAFSQWIQKQWDAERVVPPAKPAPEPPATEFPGTPGSANTPAPVSIPAPAPATPTPGSGG